VDRGRDNVVNRRTRRLVAATLVAICGIAALAAASPSPSPGSPQWHRYQSDRYGFWLRVPPGWQVARSPLAPVPRGSGEREVLALGTFRPRPGSDRECGGEPVAAFRQMGPGDALILVREIALRPAVRARTRGYFPPGPGRYDFSRIMWSAQQRRGRPGQAPVSFSASGRDFTATVYIMGSPSPELLRRVSAILARIHFRAHAGRPLAPARVEGGPCGCGHRIAGPPRSLIPIRRRDQFRR
jgi:hypothetical protein